MNLYNANVTIVTNKSNYFLIYFIDFFKFKTTKKPKKRSTLKVAHKASDSQRATIQKKNSYNVPTRVDEILDKIKQTGYDSLTDEEKDVLYQASKN